MSRRNKILVPEAREGLDQLKAKIAKVNNEKDAKYEIAREQGIDLSKNYNGNIRAKDAGKIGGTLGGSMVKEMIEMAKNNMKK
ncbi:alpha/beta-type small acid-soluble spore protein [Aquibacillus koreensis]|uniref:Alpha/beta-type small acid-soluble spore protein n=1 Tax=Aquibacillus koreensis TaxID=279446 RepID=A0A9X3WIN5_9BACI|nr:alpha/beta-type small acid-soluble spore protein [Aquibacillus koreensis]MCT2535969.1 alpha/beta-type small acid-soluble spore protein [Aquibacillus koreensis]MDC3420425.1 alpha/beta-type small acid-soluble spore protein [Aquibacillus koreensis]